MLSEAFPEHTKLKLMNLQISPETFHDRETRNLMSLILIIYATVNRDFVEIQSHGTFGTLIAISTN